MKFTPASPATLIVFITIIIWNLSIFFLGTYVAAKDQLLKTFGMVFTWLGACALVVSSGLLIAQPMPLVPIFFLFINGTVIAFSMSSLGRNLALGLPLQALVAFQIFRLPLELVLHAWSDQGTIPKTMTWTGQNFDIASGIIAIMLAPFSSRSKIAAWTANLLGIALLLNVIRVAILSSPLPFSWEVTPPLQLIFYFPYFLIVPVCIGGALAGHILLTRALILRRQGS